MGWWSRLFGRRAAAAAPSKQLVAPEPEPEPEATLEPEPVVEAAPEPVADEGEISPLRLDDALRRLRDEIPSPDEPSQS